MTTFNIPHFILKLRSAIGFTVITPEPNAFDNLPGNGAVIYDNWLGAGDSAAPTTAIVGGSIVVHE